MAPTTSTPLRGLHVLHQQPQSPIIGEHLVDVVELQRADDDVPQRVENEGTNSNSETDSNPESNPELALTEFLYEYNKGNILDIAGTNRASLWCHNVRTVCRSSIKCLQELNLHSSYYYLREHFDAFIEQSDCIIPSVTKIPCLLQHSLKTFRREHSYLRDRRCNERRRGGHTESR